MRSAAMSCGILCTKPASPAVNQGAVFV